MCVSVAYVGIWEGQSGAKEGVLFFLVHILFCSWIYTTRSLVNSRMGQARRELLRYILRPFVSVSVSYNACIILHQRSGEVECQKPVAAETYIHNSFLFWDSGGVPGERESSDVYLHIFVVHLELHITFHYVRLGLSLWPAALVK